MTNVRARKEGRKKERKEERKKEKEERKEKKERRKVERNGCRNAKKDGLLGISSYEYNDLLCLMNARRCLLGRK
jgi:hypothetical protein